MLRFGPGDVFQLGNAANDNPLVGTWEGPFEALHAGTFVSVPSIALADHLSQRDQASALPGIIELASLRIETAIGALVTPQGDANDDAGGMPAPFYRPRVAFDGALARACQELAAAVALFGTIFELSTWLLPAPAHASEPKPETATTRSDLGLPFDPVIAVSPASTGQQQAVSSSVLEIETQAEPQLAAILLAETSGGDGLRPQNSPGIVQHIAPVSTIFAPHSEVAAFEPLRFSEGVHLTGTAGSDVLRGTDGNDVIEGGAGDDVLMGLAGNDVLEGGDGNDRLFGGDDDDLLIGGTRDELGNEQAAVGSAGATAEAAAAKALAVDTRGSDDDLLDGGDGNDHLLGGRGDDVLVGGTGDDELDGGRGDDVLIGGTGDDDLKGSAGADLLIGGQGDDAVSGGDDDDWLYGDDMEADWEPAPEFQKLDDTVTEAALIKLIGPEAEDIIRLETEAPPVDITQSEIIVGTGRNDTLTGSHFGNDILIGGRGNDTLYGGRGDDTLSGGQGNDTFVFRSEFGNDTIIDFEDSDQIVLVGLAENYDLLDSQMEQVGDDVVITIGLESRITLEHTDRLALSIHDQFVFA